jgi:hypothetical protein
MNKQTDRRRTRDAVPLEEKPLNRTQATWVATWLSKTGKDVLNGWMGVYEMTPSTVADRYQVKLDDVLKAQRGDMR